MEDQLGQAERGGEMQKNEIEEARRKLEAEIDRLKEEIKRLKESHQSELEDERDESKKVKRHLKNGVRKNENCNNKCRIKLKLLDNYENTKLL